MRNQGLSRGWSYTLQLFFWVGYGAIVYASLIAWNQSHTAVLRATFSDVITSAAIAYINVLWFLPTFYGKRRYSLYIAASLALVVSVVCLRVNVLDAELSHRSVTYTYFIRSVPALGFYLITTVIWFFNNLSSAQRREVELRNSQLDSELKFLKLQLSPHFLFNTLNNIYSMAYFKDNNAATAVLKLSGMMRHMLYEGQTKFIALHKEIGFMENFIELWRLKLDEKPTISFKHTGVRDEHQIAHLIFLVFLENAFKHGNTMNGNIEIVLAVDQENVLHFKLRNDIIDVPNTLEEKSGVGLTNVKKRLDLIYPGKHRLDLQSEKTFFEVNITIDLK
jgi:sensor histidine kinase YesM